MFVCIVNCTLLSEIQSTCFNLVLMLHDNSVVLYIVCLPLLFVIESVIPNLKKFTYSLVFKGASIETQITKAL